ncbi:MAG: 1,6-anhydro-N-acetylmuramyl-L-alanine amidase AmpD [Gammaproteobacteria bacterium]
MHITEDHWLSGARRCPSPNQNERPADTPVSLVVIHGISLPPGDFGGPWIDALFTNTLDPDAHPYFAEVAGLTVSAHLLVRRDGELVQYVPFDRRAWHAGRSCHHGRENCNDFSIGIELEGTDEIPYTAQQYTVLAAVLALLEQRYPACVGHLAGHSDIAPGRKTDPGPSFDWAALAQRREGEHQA